jgi:hypothetical protein
MGEDFKVKCTHGLRPGTYFTTGSTYEVKNGKITLDNGEDSGHLINCFEDLDKYFASNFELIKDHSGEYVLIKCCKKGKRVTAVMSSMDGVYQKSANVKLKDFDGDFEKAAKAAMDKLVSIDSTKPETTVKTDGNFKARCINRHGDGGLTEGKIYEFVNGFGEWDDGEKIPQFKDNGIDRFGCFADLVKWFGGDSTQWEEVKVSGKVPTKPSYRIVKQDKYEVGDKVKVREDLKFGEYYRNASVIEDMLKYAGEIMTVFKTGGRDDDFILTEDERNWTWKPEMFEGKVIEDTAENTPLTADGFKVGDRVKVIANNSSHNFPLGEIIELIEDGHSPKWKAVAVNGKKYGCSKHWFVGEDEIEPYKAETSSFDWQSFKSGKFAVHCDTEEKANAFLKECDEQGIKWCSGSAPSSNTNFNRYKEKTSYRCDGRLDRLEYCDSDFYRNQGIHIKHFTPLNPTIKEVSRKAEVGEWIKVVMSGNRFHPLGSIEKVESLGYGTVFTENNRERSIADERYVVLEGYVPEKKPTENLPSKKLSTMPKLVNILRR